MGNNVFDQITLNLINTPEAKHLLQETEAHLRKHYKEIYEGTMQRLFTFPPHYEFGVEIKKNDKTEKGEWARQARRTMQYVDESLIKSRIRQLNNVPSQTTEDIREKHTLKPS